MDSIYQAPRTTATTKAFRPRYSVHPDWDADWQSRESRMTAKGLYLGDTIVHAAVEAIVREVVGEGLRLEAAPETDLLGISADQRQAFIKKVEGLWRQVTGSRLIDSYAKCDFKALQRQAMRKILIDGDIVQNRIIYKSGNSYHLAIQNISGTRVSNPMNGIDTKHCAAGVQRDEKLRESGYWIQVADESLQDDCRWKLLSKYNAAGREVADLIHLGDLEPGQSRGISALASAVNAALQMRRYTEATLQKAISQSVMAIVVETPEDSAQGAPQDIVGTLYGASSPVSDGGMGASSPQYEGDVQPVQETERVTGSGGILRGAPGEKVHAVESTAPGQDFAPFLEILTDLVCASIGTNAQQTLNKYRSNYTAAKGTVTTAEKGYSAMRQELAAKYCTPVYEALLDLWVRQGAVEAPGWDDPFIRSAWCACTWTGPSAVSLDALKEVKATVAAIGANLMTRERACKTMYGTDSSETFERLAQERAELEALGIKAEPDGQALMEEEEDKEEEGDEK